MKSRHASLFGLILVCSFSTLHAATQYWDGTASTVNTQSDNTTTTAQNWLSGGNWDNGTVSAPIAAWTSGDAAVFGGTAASQTITAGTLTVGNLTFGAGTVGAGTSGTAYTVAGGTVTLSSSTVTTNTDTAISSALAGNGFTKLGAAKLTLGGTDSLTGAININNGTVEMNGGSLTATGGLFLANTTSSNGTFRMTSGSMTLTSGDMNIEASSGTGAYIQTGGTVTVNTANYVYVALDSTSGSSGSFTISGGSFTTGNGMWLGVRNTGIVTVSGTGSLTLNQFRLLNVGSAGSGIVNLDGGTLTMGATNMGTATSKFNFNGGSLVLTNGNTDFLNGFATQTVKAGGAVINTQANNATFAQAMVHDSTLGATADGGLTKSGSGNLTLSGTNTYTGATVISGGTLTVTGAISNSPSITVGSGATLSVPTIVSGQTLQGVGTVSSTTTIAVGATLAPAGAATIGTLSVSGPLTLAGTASFDLNKTGATLTNDVVAGTGAVTLGGTLAIIVTGDPLVAGDSFTLFTNSGGRSGSFTNFSLPGLASGLQWDTSTLASDGKIKVAVAVVVTTPTFSLSSGGYIGAQSVTINSETGSTIHYTTDGTDPTTSGTVHTGAAPVSGVTVPVDATTILKAYATKSGEADSATGTATYNTISTPTWSLNGGGSWPTAANWTYGAVAGGSGIVADFSTLGLAGAPTVTLDGARSIGGLKFGDTGNAFGWTLATGSSGPLTLDNGASAPVITVNNQTTTITSGLAGTSGLIKNGAGTLSLTTANTITGQIQLQAGTLQLTGSGTLPFDNTLITGGTLQTSGGSEVFIGNSDNVAANWSQTGGNVTLSTGNHLYTGMGNGSQTNTISFSGGSLTITPTGVGIGATTFAIGGRSQTVVTISGSAVVDSYQTRFGWGADLSSTDGGTLNLDGGTWKTLRIYHEVTVAKSDVNFNGGLLQPTQSTTTFMTGLSSANVKEGGAKINTNGFNITIGQALLHGGVADTDGGLVKSGAGNLTLSGTNTYTGPTVISGGGLFINSQLTASPSVTAASGTTLGGNGVISGTVNVAGTLSPGSSSASTLVTGGLTLSGTYACDINGFFSDQVSVSGDLTLTGATLTVNEISPKTLGSYMIATYSGNLVGTFASVPTGYTVNYDTPGVVYLIPNGYAAWAAGFPGLSDTSPEGDPDNDGLSNLLEYVLGGDPTASDASIRPTVAVEGSSLVLRYKRNDASKTDTVQEGQWSTDLTNWFDIDPVIVNDHGTDPDDMSVTVPTSNAVDGKLFLRLHVSQSGQ